MKTNPTYMFRQLKMFGFMVAYNINQMNQQLFSNQKKNKKGGVY